MRIALFALAAAVVGAAPVAAQPWAEKMFQDGTSHDFGTVPHGAQLFHRFTITNIYAVPLQIIDVRSSCSCTTPTPSSRTLQPRESATIDVTMDARRFTGGKTVGITITVGPDFISAAQLQVSANSRADIVFNPGQVSFGTVTRGQAVSQIIDVEYAGALAWQVTEASAKELPLDLSLSELYRRPGQVGYRLKVTLKADAPVGTLKGDVFLKTNDPASPLLPVLVEATVQSAITVAPSVVNLNTVKIGETLTRRVVVRGNKPFRVTKVESSGDGITFEQPTSGTAAQVQVVSFKCQFSKAGDFKRELKITTDLQDTPVVVTIDGSAAP